jgi:hypothetical protein
MPPGGIATRIDVDAANRTADSGDPERDLATLFANANQAASTSTAPRARPGGAGC